MGGTATFDFSGTGAGLPATFIRDTALANPTASTPFAFTAPQFGTKTVTETVPAGWTLTGIVCAGDTTGVLIGADTDFDAGDTSVSVPIDAGDSVSCTFTNTEQIELIIEKVVVNDDGGTATVDDFGITTSAGTLVFGPAVEAPADTFTYTAATLAVGARHVHPRRARAGRLRGRPPGPAPTATAVPSTLAR